MHHTRHRKNCGLYYINFIYYSLLHNLISYVFFLSNLIQILKQDHGMKRDDNDDNDDISKNRCKMRAFYEPLTLGTTSFCNGFFIN